MTPLRRALAALAALGAMLGSGPAQAWSNLGHQTTGAIAWMDLRQRHPAELADLLALIRQHQDYARIAPLLEGLDEPTRERALFEILARWPDDIRGGPEDHPDWHYQLRVVHGWSWLWPFQNGNAAFGFGYNYAKLANPCTPAVERAKAIGWLIHIIGDVQQPLHAGHQMTRTFELTDRAGELAWVRRPNGIVTDLHHYWDQTLDDSGAPVPAGFADWADALMAKWTRTSLGSQLQPAADPQLEFAGFLDESAELARTVGYTGTYLLAATDRQQAPQVSLAEQALALDVAERRIATGGYRISDLLARAIDQAHAANWTCPA